MTLTAGTRLGSTIVGLTTPYGGASDDLSLSPLGRGIG
jgi:hypothetical protein